MRPSSARRPSSRRRFAAIPRTGVPGISSTLARLRAIQSRSGRPKWLSSPEPDPSASRMDFDWDTDTLEFARAASEFGSTLNTDLAERDRQGRFDRHAWKACAEFGMLGLTMPAAHGGIERSLASALRVFEGLGYSCLDNGLLFSLGAQLGRS